MTVQVKLTRSARRLLKTHPLPPGWGRSDQVVAVVAILLTFIPYAGIPLGTNTNVPASSLLFLYLVLRSLSDRTVFWGTLLACAAPIMGTAFRVVFSPYEVPIAPLIVWCFYVVHVPGMAVAVAVLRRHVIPVLSIGIFLSALLALIQRAAFANGTVPWLWYYWLPGYASVQDVTEEILLYHPRPFGLFPEPSFMAGSLVSAAFVLVAAAHRYRRGYTRLDWLAVLTLMPALILSVSGSLILALPLLVIAFCTPLLRRSFLTVTLLPVVFAVALMGAATVLLDRTAVFNPSWVDRPASIVVGGYEMLSGPTQLFLGLGSGMATLYYVNRFVPFWRIEHYEPILDIFSVTGRVILENGLLFGLPVIIWMALPFLRGRGTVTLIIGASALLSWLVISGLAISYYSAAWLWTLPGAFWGLSNPPSPRMRSDS